VLLALLEHSLAEGGADNLAVDRTSQPNIPMIVSCQSLIEDPTLDKLGTSWRWRNVIYTNVAPIYR
jgi:hypothetical protein